MDSNTITNFIPITLQQLWGSKSMFLRKLPGKPFLLTEAKMAQNLSSAVLAGNKGMLL